MYAKHVTNTVLLPCICHDRLTSEEAITTARSSGHCIPCLLVETLPYHLVDMDQHGHGEPACPANRLMASRLTQPNPSSPAGITHVHDASTRGSSTSGSGRMVAVAVDKLASFLHRDIEPKEGQRLLLPFLCTTSLLRLSECSTGLQPYRHHLSRLKLIGHGSGLHHLDESEEERPGSSSRQVPLVVVGLSQLLAHQRARLEHLCVDDSSVLPALAGWLMWGGARSSA